MLGNLAWTALSSIPPVCLVWLAVWVVRLHDFRVFGRREAVDGTPHYVFGIHNAEELDLRGGIEIELRVLLAAGEFLRRPTLLSGVRRFDVKTEWPEPGCFRVSAQVIRPLTTWSIQCSTNGCEGDVLMFIRHAGREYEIRSGEHREPRRWQSGLLLYATVTVLAMLTYSLPVAQEWRRPVAVPSWQPMDSWALCVIAVVSGLALLLCRRPALPTVEGYLAWEEEARPTWDEAAR
jgi:hypothetical protein